MREGEREKEGSLPEGTAREGEADLHDCEESNACRITSMGFLRGVGDGQQTDRGSGITSEHFT